MAATGIADALQRVEIRMPRNAPEQVSQLSPALLPIALTPDAPLVTSTANARMP